MAGPGDSAGLIGFGILLRPNAIIAAPLLAAYVLWPARFDWKRTALLYLPALAFGYGLIEAVYYGILDVKREHPAHSLLMFDLGGITHFTGENQFPVTWNAEETALLTSRCYDPEHWDSYWTIEPCKFVMARIEGQATHFRHAAPFGSMAAAIFAHPIAYLMHRAAFMWRFLAGSNLTIELFKLTVPNGTPLSQNQLFLGLVAVHDTLKPTPLFRVGSWLVASRSCSSCGVAAPDDRLRGVRDRRLRVRDILCAELFPLGVAADFRYAYWCVLATLAVAAAACVMGRDSDR